MGGLLGEEGDPGVGLLPPARPEGLCVSPGVLLRGEEPRSVPGRDACSRR